MPSINIANDAVGRRHAFCLGALFARELNHTPEEAQNWSTLTKADDIPHGDYKTLANKYGDVTDSMAQAYRDGFNRLFIVIRND